MFMQILISGLVVGSCYAVVSVGMTTLFQATTILNFAHGECVMIGAFIFFALTSLYKLDYSLSMIVTVAAGCLLGLIMERTVFRRLMYAPHLNVVLATNGFLYFYRGVARHVWGSEPRFPPQLLTIPPISLGGVIITAQDIAIIISVGVLAMLFVWVFLFTGTGLKMRAAAQTIRGAALVGINTERFFAVVWAIAVGAGAIAGILLGPMYSVSPEMGDAVTLRAFAAMTLGGFGNIGGAAIGGILIGALESLAGFYIWFPLKEIVAYAVILAVLLVRPAGLFGTKKV